jgi:hypothetical protein
MKTYGGVDVWAHVSLTSALVGGEWSASRPGRFTPGKRALGTHWIGRVGPRAGLDDMEKWKFLPPPRLELRPLGRPACNQSLYRLSYPGSFFRDWEFISIDWLTHVIRNNMELAAARVRAQVTLCGIYGGQSGTGAAFSEYFSFPCQFSFHRLLYTLHL